MIKQGRGQQPQVDRHPRGSRHFPLPQSPGREGQRGRKHAPLPDGQPQQVAQHLGQRGQGREPLIVQGALIRLRRDPSGHIAGAQKKQNERLQHQQRDQGRPLGIGDFHLPLIVEKGAEAEIQKPCQDHDDQQRHHQCLGPQPGADITAEDRIGPPAAGNRDRTGEREITHGTGNKGGSAGAEPDSATSTRISSKVDFCSSSTWIKNSSRTRLDTSAA